MPGVLDPQRCNISIDANALDRDGSPSDAFIDRILSLGDAGEIHFVVPNSVATEVSHPHTPDLVKSNVNSLTYTVPVERTHDEEATFARVRSLLQGNAAAGKHDMDAEHLFEAAKYGGGYFITHDERVLRKRAEIEKLLGPVFCVVTMEEFLYAYDRFGATRQ